MTANDSAASKETSSEMLGGCCVCSDEEGWADNFLVYCDGDGCSVAVHQACYGILRVPEGNWYCRRCEAIRSGKYSPGDIRCELCHHLDGALKPTESGKWCHVLCALYIPEATFGDVQAMEPIILKNVQRDRFGRTCSICEGKEGACTQCSCSSATNSSNHGKVGTTCTTLFHVTCAQIRGLLCELQIGGTTRYPAYCEEHLRTLKPGLKIKKLPPYKGPPGSASPTHSPPALRSRRKDASERINGGSSPLPNSGEHSEMCSTRASKSSGEGSKHKDTSHKDSRHSSKYKDNDERKKAKLLKKRHAENGQVSSEKGDDYRLKLTSKSGSVVEKKSRGRQKGSSKKHAISLSPTEEPKESQVPSNGNGLVFYGKLSTEAAIRVRYSSGKDVASTSEEHPAEESSKASQNSPTHKIDLWSVFSQKRPADSGIPSPSSVVKKPEPDSLDELLEDTFWRETGRFLLSEIQQTAPSDIVELLHALYQVELENQQLEAKIASISSAADSQRVTAARLAVPLSSSLPNFPKPGTVQTGSNSTTNPTAVVPPVQAAAVPFVLPGGVLPNVSGSLASGTNVTSSFAAKTVPTNSSGSNPQQKAMPPAMPSAYVPNDMATMQQMQLQLYQHLYQQQLQQHMGPATSTGQPLQQQPKLEVGPSFSSHIPMSPPMIPSQSTQQPQTSASSVLSPLSISSQQQRSLPLKLIEPAPSTGSLLTAGSTGQTMPPEIVLVPPPPQLLSAPLSTSSTVSSTSPVTTSVGNKRPVDTNNNNVTKAQMDTNS